MKWSAFSSGERRTIVTGGLVLALVLLVRIILLPYIHAVAETTLRVEEGMHLLERERTLTASATQYPELLESAAIRLAAAAPRLLPGSSETAAQGALAQVLERAAARAPATIQQLDALPVETIGEGLSAVSMAVQAESDLEGMLTLLAALSAGPILLNVEDLQVTTSGQRVLPTAGAELMADVLTFRFLITGVVLKLESPLPVDHTAGSQRIETDPHAAAAAAPLIAGSATEVFP